MKDTITEQAQMEKAIMALARQDAHRAACRAGALRRWALHRAQQYGVSQATPKLPVLRQYFSERGWFITRVRGSAPGGWGEYRAGPLNSTEREESMVFAELLNKMYLRWGFDAFEHFGIVRPDVLPDIL